MPHGGYHGTQIIGGKITQLGDEFKDSQGNIKPQFNVTGDKDSGFNVSMANETFNPRSREAMYASPDDILQNIIDRKDVLKLQPSPDRPGMNLYQDTIQDFRTSSPTNMAAYGQRFPLTQFMMEGPRALAENSLFGNIISAMGGAKNKVGEFASGLFPQGFMPGLGAEFDKLGSQLAEAPGNFKKDVAKMFGMTDDEPTKANLRDDFGIKKNTAEDIVEGSLFTEDNYRQMFGEPMIDLAGGEGPQPLGKVTETNLPAKSQSEPGTLEFIQEQGKKNVEDFPNVLETDKFGQSVLRKLGLLDQAKTVNAPGSVNEIQLAELNPSQKAVLDQRANRFAFDQGLATPEDMLNKIRPLDRSGIFGFLGNEANLQDIINFYKNNPTTQI